METEISGIQPTLRISMKDVLGFLKNYEAITLVALEGQARTEKIARIDRLRRQLIKISAIESSPNASRGESGKKEQK